MKIESLRIRNYKFIRDLEIKQLDDACIFIGRNSVGKTAILDAILTACGQKEVLAKHFNELSNNIEIAVRMSFTEADLQLLHRCGILSRYKKYELFYRDFCEKFPSYKEGVLSFTFVANKDGRVRYSDGVVKDNEFIPLILPKIYYIDHRRNIDEIETDILRTGLREKTVTRLAENQCMFDESKKCTTCFQCIGKIEQKPVAQLSIFETEKLLEYKILHADIDAFVERMNKCFSRNSGQKDRLVTKMNVDLSRLMDVEVVRYREASDMSESIHDMSEGMKSIYILSLLEA